MITFATLFLGLVVGVQPVEIHAGENVAAVELFLDGTSAGRLEAPPWRFEVDFGEPSPHDLVAAAFDASGRELERVRQWINLPPSRAKLSVALGEPDESGGRSLRLTWESTVGKEPRAVRVTLDAADVPVTDPRHVVLPSYDPLQLHFLRVEAEFSDQVRAVEELTFGGAFSDQVSNALTAVVVRTEKKSRRPPDLQGHLLKDGKPLDVVAVEHGQATVVIVTDIDYIEKDLREMLKKMFRFDPAKALTRKNLHPQMEVAQKQHPVLRRWTLSMGDSFRLLWPVPEVRQAAQGVYEVYPTSPPFDAAAQGYLHLLGTFDTSLLPHSRQNFAAAVAAAGMKAARERGRRAVVLQLSSRPRSAAVLDPAAVGRYLARLQVPLYVWASDPAGATLAGWETAEKLASTSDVNARFRELREDVGRQWVAWVAGEHLPHEIRLADGTKDLELVGSAEP